jgi:hypothetical protein
VEYHWHFARPLCKLLAFGFRSAIFVFFCSAFLQFFFARTSYIFFARGTKKNCPTILQAFCFRSAILVFLLGLLTKSLLEHLPHFWLGKQNKNALPLYKLLVFARPFFFARPSCKILLNEGVGPHKKIGQKRGSNNNNSLYPELSPIPVSTTTHNPGPPAHKCAVGPTPILFCGFVLAYTRLVLGERSPLGRAAALLPPTARWGGHRGSKNLFGKCRCGVLLPSMWCTVAE